MVTVGRCRHKSLGEKETSTETTLSQRPPPKRRLKADPRQKDANSTSPHPNDV